MQQNHNRNNNDTPPCLELVRKIGSATRTDRDVITNVQFSDDSSYMALTTQNGRAAIFQQGLQCDTDKSSYFYSTDVSNLTHNNTSSQCPIRAAPVSSILMSKIKVHEKGHDWQTNSQIDCSVTTFAWMKGPSPKSFVTANEKRIRIWEVKHVSRYPVWGAGKFVKFEEHDDPLIKIGLKLELPDLHNSSRIRSIRLSSNEFMLSVDDCRIVKWCLQKPSTAITLRERTSSPCLCQEEEKEWEVFPQVTSARFHNDIDNLIGYSTKYGTLDYLDLRYSNQSKKKALVLQHQPYQVSASNPNPLMKYIQMLSDFVFCENGYGVVTRNFSRCKLWDMRKPKVPVRQMSIYPSIVSVLEDLVCDDSGNRILQIFNLAIRGNSVLTNHFSSSFHLLNLQENTNFRVTIDSGGRTTMVPVGSKARWLTDFSPDPCTNSVQFSPCSNMLGVTSANNAYLYSLN